MYGIMWQKYREKLKKKIYRLHILIFNHPQVVTLTLKNDHININNDVTGELNPLLKKLERTSQKFLIVLSSLINDEAFLNLSDVEVLKILNKNFIEHW